MMLPLKVALAFCVVLGFALTEVQGTCYECQLALDWIYNRVGRQPTAESVDKLLNTVCNGQPIGVSSECRYIVAEYREQLIQLILQKKSSEQVCLALKECKPDNDAGIKDMVVSKPSPALTEVPRGTCYECELALDWIYIRVGRHPTAESVDKLLNTVCKGQPIGVSGECRYIVKKYREQLIQLILQKKSSEQVCLALKECKPDNDAGIKESQVAQSFDPCQVCQIAVIWVQGQVGMNETEKRYELGLSVVCSQLPFEIQATCDVLVQTRDVQLATLMTKESNATKICQQAEQCPASSHELRFSPRKEFQLPARNEEPGPV